MNGEWQRTVANVSLSSPPVPAHTRIHTFRIILKIRFTQFHPEIKTKASFCEASVHAKVRPGDAREEREKRMGGQSLLGTYTPTPTRKYQHFHRKAGASSQHTGWGESPWQKLELLTQVSLMEAMAKRKMRLQLNWQSLEHWRGRTQPQGSRNTKYFHTPLLPI
jgi:hypothetical protein